MDEWDRPLGDGRSYVQVHRFRVVKETPKGVWLEGAGRFGQDRFVLRDARKRFACPSVEEAWESWRSRKQRQLRLLRLQIAHIEEVLSFRAETVETVRRALNTEG
jgi:hypothetical protein